MTTGFLLPLMLCTAALVLAALIGLALMLLGPRARPKEVQSSSSAGTTARAARRGWISWLPYFGLALLLAVWSIWGALFFLGVAGLLRQNPAAGSDSTVSEDEKKTARRTYTWLFWSPLLTVPALIIALINAYDSSTNGRVLAAFLPLVFHLPMLAGLTSKSVFVYRHTQQGILLISVRAALAGLAASIGQYPDEGALLFLLGNGVLWLFSSIWGWDQVNRGDCWLMRRKGETAGLRASGPGKVPAQIHLEKSREFIQSFKLDEAKAHALAAFRTGTRDIRLQAIRELEVLGEVEKF